ncbi:MAG: FKBP-type peptidyl-prolyl cis-trans isomerase [Phycisphaeraceae bacterium]|nr:FKBP-type peptidyl-prolyl cis-trans isomerase [Phycisphaeraceae bacterium]
MVSYMAGLRAGQSLRVMPMQVKPDTALAMRGFEEAVAGQPSASAEELQSLVEQVNKIVSARLQVLQDEFILANKAYLEENAKKDGVKTTLSGLQYKIIDPGAGPSPKDGDTVTVNYSGKLVNGRVFDSSYERGQPASFPVNGVIPGFSEALKMMKPGAKWELVIPPILAYGDQGAGNTIPGGAVLIFEVELVKIGE